jgi:hypothetical protein
MKATLFVDQPVSDNAEADQPKMQALLEFPEESCICMMEQHQYCRSIM